MNHDISHNTVSVDKLDKNNLRKMSFTNEDEVVSQASKVNEYFETMQLGHFDKNTLNTHQK